MAVDPSATVVNQRLALRFIGAFVVLLAVMLIVVSLTVRGTITPLEAIGLWLMVVGIWIYIKA